MAAILIAVYWICKAVNRIWRSWKLAYRQRNMEMQAEPTSESTPLMDPMNGDRKNRPMTIEIFRGMAIVLMIFVGYGGGHYWFITPATWNGLHVGDFYSPMLTFALGVFIAYALDFQLKTKFATEMIVSRIIRVSYEKTCKVENGKLTKSNNFHFSTAIDLLILCRTLCANGAGRNIRTS